MISTWRLGAMYSDWKRKKGIIDPSDSVLHPHSKSGQRASTDLIFKY
tara:strand:- start:140 stop:280 length:141 start_codon:yes stop_codon:yes gene_type:complete